MKLPSLLLFLLATLVCSGPLGAETADALRGEPVGWARLKIPAHNWKRHARSDPVLMDFLRENTSLNLESSWHEADVLKLPELCAYPFLFSQGIHQLQDPAGINNLSEYLRRGGFLMIDSCINRRINGNPDAYLAGQVQALSRILPEAVIEPVKADHPLYSCYFKIPGGEPPHTFDSNVYDGSWAKHGLYAIRIGPRLVGIISLSGLQCGWDKMPGPQDHDLACMKMLVNIYVYAMLQAE